MGKEICQSTQSVLIALNRLLPDFPPQIRRGLRGGSVAAQGAVRSLAAGEHLHAGHAVLVRAVAVRSGGKVFTARVQFSAPNLHCVPTTHSYRFDCFSMCSYQHILLSWAAWQL